MPTLFATDAWLPQGWSRNVRFEIDPRGVITRVEPGADPAGEAVERIDGPVLPGLCDLHSHGFQRAMAGLAERTNIDSAGDSFWTWREAMYDLVGRLTPDQVESITAQAYLELLKGGYTAVCEFHYLHHDPDGAPYADPAEISERIVAAAAQVNMGLTLLPVLYMTSNFGGAPPHAGQRRFLGDAERILRLVDCLRQRHGDSIRVGAAPHSLRAVPPPELDALVSGLASIDATAPIHMHIAEQSKEVDDCLAWSGSRPVQSLLANQAVAANWCLVHATHMTIEETRALAGSAAVAGLCPTTEANLGDGLFPLPEYASAHGRYGIGSDSNISTTCMEELRWLEYGQRLSRRQRNVMAGEERCSVGEALYRAALAGGAQASGRPIAGLAVGQRADLLVLDPTHPTLIERDPQHWLDALIFCGNSNPIRDVMVGGKWAIRNGQHALEQTVAARYRLALRDARSA